MKTTGLEVLISAPKPNPRRAVSRSEPGELQTHFLLALPIHLQSHTKLVKGQCQEHQLPFLKGSWKKCQSAQHYPLSRRELKRYGIREYHVKSNVIYGLQMRAIAIK